MEGQIRYCNIRGYVQKVEVQRKHKNGEWIVKVISKTVRVITTKEPIIESVPEHLFYHREYEGWPLLGRDCPEFKRLYPNHPVTREVIYPKVSA